MLRSRIAFVALLLASPLIADTLSSEFPASAALWQAANANVAMAVGATRSYEVMQIGDSIFGNQITADGTPDMNTWRPFGSGRLIGVAAIGDDFFVLSDTAARDTLTLRRASDGKEAKFHILTTALSGAFRSDGTRLWYVYNRTPSVYGIIFDANLNVAVPEFQVRNAGGVMGGAAARGLFLALLTDSPFFSNFGTLSYWSIDGNGKSKSIPSTPVTGAPFVSNGTDFLFALSGPSTASGVWALHCSAELAPFGGITTIFAADSQETM